MFYLLKRVDEKQFTPGEVVMVLADFSGIKAGTKGVITEVYHEGVMVTWEGKRVRQPQVSEYPDVEEIQDMLNAGESFMAVRGWVSDGFGRDELEYLGVETEKHPEKS